ncbi:gluconate kinase [Sinobacterium caligoides]|uniref:Gluconate kinase n=1 Tax=Sinobacterium caligoides TaxID=933926 RepID=A0A3N2DMN5_9GAMM|nr:shikimate kinase [Sinobacterium caligoides]ROS01061.1 gluconate kinase [Sinobacterium caligoides]
MSQKLDLQLAPPILFLFGLSGAGKSYVGNLIGDHAGWYVYHADDDLTEEMIRALREHRPFDDNMRDEYFAVIVERIHQLRLQHERLVVTQGVYKRRHREYLLKEIPGMEMILVEATDASILHRLDRRESGISGASASALRLDFEYPADNCKVIVNQHGQEQVIEQLNAYFSPASIR